MKTTISIPVFILVFLATSSPCFALWEIAPVTKERAKEMGMEVRSIAAGPNDVRVELEFKIDGVLKDFSRVDLRMSDGDKTLVSAALKEDRSKPGRVVVSFAADRTRLDKLNLWVMVPGGRGGIVHDVRVKDFVELEKGR